MSNENLTYVVRIKEKGQADWGIGFETTVTSCSFVDLKPNTVYEIRVSAKNRFGEGDSVYKEIRTPAENPEHLKHQIGFQGAVPKLNEYN